MFLCVTHVNMCVKGLCVTDAHPCVCVEILVCCRCMCMCVQRLFCVADACVFQMHIHVCAEVPVLQMYIHVCAEVLVCCRCAPCAEVPVLQMYIHVCAEVLVCCRCMCTCVHRQKPEVSLRHFPHSLLHLYFLKYRPKKL